MAQDIMLRVYAHLNNETSTLDNIGLLLEKLATSKMSIGTIYIGEGIDIFIPGPRF